MNTWSMGMSEDCALAVAEGATMVRVGTAQFGARPSKPDAWWEPLSLKSRGRLPVERSLLRWGFLMNRTKSSGASSALQVGRGFKEERDP